MDNKNKRYQNMEQNMILVLVADLLLFIGYLVAAGNGIIWLKVILFILTILVSVLCLWFLYLNGELRKQRSLWMGTAAAAIGICILFSLILNYPSPHPATHSDTSSSTAENIN